MAVDFCMLGGAKPQLCEDLRKQVVCYSIQFKNGYYCALKRDPKVFFFNLTVMAKKLCEFENSVQNVLRGVREM